MTVALVVALLGLGAAVLAGATWRRAVDERASVKEHQRTLETLRQLRGRRGHEGAFGSGASRSEPGRRDPSEQNPSVGGAKSPAPRGVDNGTSRTPAARSPAADPGHGDVAHRTSRAGDRDAYGRDRGGSVSAKADAGARPVVVSADEHSGVAHTIGRYSELRRAREEPRHGERTERDVVPPPAVAERRPVEVPPWLPRTGMVVSVAAIVVVAGALALALVLTSHSPRLSNNRPHNPQPVGRGHPATPSVITPTASSVSDATYTAPAGHYTVELDATGPCWVMATDATTSHVEWTGTLQAGEHRQLPVSGGLVVRLGAVGVTVLLDGKPVQFPPQVQVPFTMTFQSA